MKYRDTTNVKHILVDLANVNSIIKAETSKTRLENKGFTQKSCDQIAWDKWVFIYKK